MIKDTFPGGEHITFNASTRLVFRTKAKLRALKINKILNERNKR